jgi:hypothetical protein
MPVRDFKWLHDMHERPPKLPKTVLDAVMNFESYCNAWTEDACPPHSWHMEIITEEYHIPVFGKDLQDMDDEEFNARARNFGPGFYVRHPRSFHCLRSTTLYLVDESDHVLKVRFEVQYMPNTTCLIPVGIRVNWSNWDVDEVPWGPDGVLLVEEIDPLLTKPCDEFQFQPIGTMTESQTGGGTVMTWSVAEEFGERIMQHISALCRCVPLHYPALPIF